MGDMSGDTLETILSYVNLRANIPSDDPKFTPAVMKNIVNMALRQASTDQDPFWLRTSASLSLVAGTSEYATSAFSRFVKVARIEDDEHYNLVAVSPSELSEYQRINGYPVVYTVEGNVIRVGPIPDVAATYTLHYYQWETELVADGDRPLLPTQYTDYLVCRAALIAAQRNGDPATAVEMRADIQEWQRRIRDDIRQMRAMPRIRVRNDFSRWGR